MIQGILKLTKLKVGVLFIIIFLHVFMIMRADWIYGSFSPVMEKVLSIYLIFVVAIFALFDLKLPFISGMSALTNFFLTFLITSVIMIVIVTFIAPAGFLAEFEPIQVALGYGFLHGFIKALDEELIFRFALSKILVAKTFMVDAISSVSFGIFHIGLFGVGIPQVIVLVVLGFIWMQLFRRFGVMGATGSHYSWNLGVQGGLSALIGV